jgi:DNA-directed RNA polymerase alpha subunit/DNA-directed RNA polymerase subunit L
MSSTSTFVFNIQDDSDGGLHFEFKNINVSFVNALRRTILSDIPTAVFKTTPYELNQSEFLANTTRMNNELIKHRLSGIPIHLKNLTPEYLETFVIEVNLENETTDQVMYVTTEHFQIVPEKGHEDKQMPNRDELFPINELSNQYIDLVILRHKLSESFAGDKLHFRCKVSAGTAKEDSNFSVVSLCTYANTLDHALIQKQLDEKQKDWKLQHLDVEFETQNWKNLEGKRFFKPNAFDFKLRTIGVYSNVEIVVYACKILIHKLKVYTEDPSKFSITNQSFTLAMTNTFDIVLFNEDFTVGKMLEYCFHSAYYENAKQLHYCGFTKTHPHDNNCILRIAYKRAISLSEVKTDFTTCIAHSISVIENIMSAFIQ